MAQTFVEAADAYAKSPTALQLRAMNIIYETTKDRGVTILLPRSMVDAMNPAGFVGLAAAEVGGTKSGNSGYNFGASRPNNIDIRQKLIDFR